MKVEIVFVHRHDGLIRVPCPKCGSDVARVLSQGRGDYCCRGVGCTWKLSSPQRSARDKSRAYQLFGYYEDPEIGRQRTNPKWTSRRTEKK